MANEVKEVKAEDVARGVKVVKAVKGVKRTTEARKSKSEAKQPNAGSQESENTAESSEEKESYFDLHPKYYFRVTKDVKDFEYNVTLNPDRNDFPIGLTNLYLESDSTLNVLRQLMRSMNVDSICKEKTKNTDDKHQSQDNAQKAKGNKETAGEQNKEETNSHADEPEVDKDANDTEKDSTVKPKKKVPEGQSKLTRQEKKLCEKQIRFKKYYDELFDCTQVGLQGKHPQPDLAKKAIDKLKEEVLITEGGRIKNMHMFKLGCWALGFIAVSATLGFLSKYGVLASPFWQDIEPYLMVWMGAMAGAWLSFGVRKMDLKFENLAIIEADRMSAPIRLLFVGLASWVLVLFLGSGIVEFSVGNIDFSHVLKSTTMQLAVGAVAGLLERMLAVGLAAKTRSATTLEVSE